MNPSENQPQTSLAQIPNDAPVTNFHHSETRSAGQNPAAVYLASLSPGSRRSM